MKILYAIQGTGNGHIARAEDVVPILQEYGETDVFISGAQADIRLPYTVKYKSKGLSFYFGKRGGVDFVKTFRRNSARKIYKEIEHFPADSYDFVINDFEPISSWACRVRGVRCIGLSHQAALLSPLAPKPKKVDPLGYWILHHYAPVGDAVSFHFAQYDENMYTPVIRSRIRNMEVTDKGHYTVYLPAYDDKKLLPLLATFKSVKWHIFSKHTRKRYHFGKLTVQPVSNEEFSSSMATATGIFCGAGFETPAEALYLGKKLLVVPMKGQYEQQCNAAALKLMGVPVMKKVKRRFLSDIGSWLETDTRVPVTYGDVVSAAVHQAVEFARNGIKK